MADLCIPCTSLKHYQGQHARPDRVLHVGGGDKLPATAVDDDQLSQERQHLHRFSSANLEGELHAGSDE